MPSNQDPDRATGPPHQQSNFFVGPDNGICTVLLNDVDEERFFQVEPERLSRPACGRTFHGRDIMAPVAAALASGISAEEVGPLLQSADLVRLADALATRDKKTINGRVVWIDRFGNLVTNISMALVRQFLASNDLASLTLHTAGREISCHAPTYAVAPDGKPFFLVGSRNTLEIAVKDGSAATVTGICLGSECRLLLR